MGSISCHITPLAINSLGGGHTHTHTHKHIYRRPHRNDFKKPGECRPMAGAPGLKTPYMETIWVAKIGEFGKYVHITPFANALLTNYFLL